MSKLNIDDIVNVVVTTAGAATPREGFNIGIIIGKTVGTGMSADNRTIVVTSLPDMVAAGYATTSPEYKAAEKYFAQIPRPAKLVVGLNVGTTEGGTTTYETWPVAIAACRDSNSSWHGVYVADGNALSTAEIQAIATYVNGITAVFFFEDGTAADITSATTDVFSVLKGLSIKRAFGLYSTTQYAGAAAMGRAMGLNNGSPNSAFTMAYKTLAGVTPDDLDNTAVGNLKGKNANYYVTRGGTYNVLENGVCGDGTFFDEVIGLDQLANDMQIGCMDVLANNPTKVPYTDAGVLQLIVACNAACEDSLRRGFLAPGVWNQASVLDLETGDTLAAGYLVQAEAVADQSAANRAQRICPPIYACVNLAGAIHNATIKINVQ